MDSPGIAQPTGAHDRPEVSVLLVSWNTFAETRACLEALPEAGAGTRFEVIAVDNGSADGSAELLSGRPGLHVIRNDTNRGYAAAVNQAYARATGEFILLLNSGARFSADALGVLVGFLRQRPDVAGVAPLYRNPDGGVQQYDRRLPTLAGALASTTMLGRLPGFRSARRGDAMQEADFSQPRRIEQAPTSALLLRRDALGPDAVFDEDLPLYYPDVLLAHSLAKAGREVWMTPHAAVTHTMGASTRLLDPVVRARHRLAGLMRYLARTRPWPVVRLVRLLVGLDHVVRRALALPGQLGGRDLLAALRGHGGPLPGGWRGTWVVMLSGSGWAIARHRQQALAREVAKDRRVLYVDPPGRRMRWRLTLRNVGPSLWHAVPPVVLPFGAWLPPANVVNRWFAARALRRFLRDRPGPRLLWLGEALAAPAAGRLAEQGTVYDVTDLDWTFTPAWNRWHLRRGERRAVARADLVLLSSPALPGWLSRPIGANAPMFVVPNGCDSDLFGPDGPVPGWLRRLPSPRLVYVGALDTRCFDADLVARVATDHPEWTFVLAGPATARVAAPLAALPNVRVIGPIPYADVPGLVGGADVCLIPYRLGGLVDWVMPKKLYEYLAAGKPVVATALPALRGLEDLVELAPDPAGFVAGIEKALAQATTPSAVSARRSAAVDNSWSARGEQVHQLLALLESRFAGDQPRPR
jgi:GT2 family glycosyltransferase/glycosyltransferase involved in cell wall biosynthesis